MHQGEYIRKLLIAGIVFLCLSNIPASDSHIDNSIVYAQEPAQKVQDQKPKLAKTERPVTKAKPKKQAKPKPKPVVKQQPIAPPVTPVAGCDQLSQLLANIGLSAQEVDAAIQIATRESTCNSQAVNASSGACNFFQEFPCGKWGGLNDIIGHLKGADTYAKTRYGGWLEALAFWNANNWW